MLSAEAAKAALAERREQASTSGRLTGALGRSMAGLGDNNVDAGKTVARLARMPRRGRRALFGAACPGLGGELAAVFEHASRLTYMGAWDRRPFRAPRAPHLARQRVVSGARRTIPELSAHAADPEWLARWAGHLGAQTWTVSDHLVGWLLSAAIDDGDERVLDILIASLDGSDEVATMGRHTPIALLCAGREEGWQRVEELLLSAQRQEGLRQAILEVVDEAHPEAFRRMLALVLEHGLSRFASVSRAVSVWFGIEALAGDRRRVEAIAELTLGFLTDHDARPRAVEAGEPIDVYLALWATATEDVHAAIELALPVLEDGDAERRFAAARFMSEANITSVAAGLRGRLYDEDLRVAATAVHALGRLPAGSFPASYDALDVLLGRLPKRTADLEPADWLGPLPALKRTQVGALLLRHVDPPDVERVLPHSNALDSWDRGVLASKVGDAPLTPGRRAALLDFLGDTSADVRAKAIAAATRMQLTDEEALELEPLLRRKPGDLRRGVLELILARGEQWALDAAERLLATGHAQQRLGGVELLRRVAEGGSSRASAADARLRSLEAEAGDGEVAEATRRAIGEEDTAGATEADGFGLFDPSAGLTPPSVPRRTGFELETAASSRVLELLDGLIEQHADTEVLVLPYWGDPERVLLGAADRLGLRHHQRQYRLGETDVEPPLLDLWTSFAENLPADARDGDGQQLLRAFLHCRQTRLRFGYREAAKVQSELGIRRPATVEAVLEWLVVDCAPGSQRLAAALDAAEDVLTRLTKRELRDQYAREFPALETVRELASQPFAAPHRSLLERHWRLERWLAEPPGLPPAKFEETRWDGRRTHERRSERVPRRPPVDVVVRAFERDVATEADLIDQLVGPRGLSWNFHELHELSSRHGLERAGGRERTAAVVERVRQRVIALELARGEAPTQAAEAARALRDSGGLDILIGALGALGRERFVRGWASDGESRKSVFSHLVAASRPREDDTPERFAEAVRKAKIATKRLHEVACYAPQWARHVELALGVEGVEDAVWWLHAHTKDDRWRVGTELKEDWERSVADRTELSAAQLVDGAVDVRWFRRMRERLGDDELGGLLDAAKYGSTAGGHKRAELFARSMRGEVEDGALLERIEAKRHQDSVRALGLLPLPTDDGERDTVLARRYEALHEFKRQSRQFGRQRQASEGRATEIGMENLARTAGFADPVRLTWAMEATATADLAGDGVSVMHEDVTVGLRVDEDGRPVVDVSRGDKALKSVPAKLRKVPEIKALTSRSTELRRQMSRIRVSLEQALVRGDELTGDELARYREHVLLWPALSRLVLVGEGIIGYPAGDGRALRDHEGGMQAIGRRETLRIAHPLDLLARGDWPQWQRDVLERRVVQPCKQLFRELYVPVDSERTDAGGSRRYAGHQVQPARARALLVKRGWRVDEYEGARRIDHHEHVVAQLGFLAGFGTPVDVEPPTLEEVRFRNARDDSPLPIGEVPPRLFSEVMRDLDLVVSVAHMGGVDPEASQSSLEMRAALVEETAAMLGRDNVTIEGPRAVVQGEISRYSVHLGSANVHRLPGGSVCIVPVHSQQRGRVFLPFADDDPKTAEVVAKVLMLSRDRDIRDPTVLEQLRA